MKNIKQSFPSENYNRTFHNKCIKILRTWKTHTIFPSENKNKLSLIKKNKKSTAVEGEDSYFLLILGDCPDTSADDISPRSL
jgi:hypothetical protein